MTDARILDRTDGLVVVSWADAEKYPDLHLHPAIHR